MKATDVNHEVLVPPEIGEKKSFDTEMRVG